MSLVTIMTELGRFIRTHITKIVTGALLMSVLVVGGRYYVSQSSQSFDTQAYRYLEHVYAQNPATFKFLITNEDGTLFGNSFLIDEYLSQPEVIEKIESQTGIDFSTWVTSEQALELYKTSQFRGGLAGIRDTSSDVITLRVLVGQSEQENMTIANAYANLLKEGNIPFLQHKTILFLGGVESVEETTQVNQVTVGAIPESLNIYSQLSVRSFVIYGIIGFIGGAIVTTGILFARRLWQDKIDYAFEYVWELDDTHLMSYQESLEQVAQLWQVPEAVNRLVVSETLWSQLPTRDTLHYATSISDAKQGRIEEIVFLIQSRQTTKKWYTQQMKLARLYNVPIKIIHIVT